MTLLECLQDLIITQDSALAAKLPGGLRPNFLPQTGTAFQATAVVRVISSSPAPPTHDGGASPWAKTRIEITVWAEDFLSSEQIALNIYSKMAPVNGFLSGSSGKFSTVEVQGPRTVNDNEGRLAGAQIDVLGWLQRNTLS